MHRTFSKLFQKSGFGRGIKIYLVQTFKKWYLFVDLYAEYLKLWPVKVQVDILVKKTISDRVLETCKLHSNSFNQPFVIRQCLDVTIAPVLLLFYPENEVPLVTDFFTTLF